jgi:hypothetical protein
LEIVIEHQKTVDKLVELCPVFRASLPVHKRTPWSPEKCVVQAALRTFKEVNRIENRRSLVEMDADVEPTPTPSAIGA